MAEKLLVGNTHVFTLGKDNRHLPQGGILIEGALIKEIAPYAELKAKHPGVQTLDLSGKVIMPGMICAHHHIYSAFARGMGLKTDPPANFVQILERVWWRLDKVLTQDDNYFSGMLAFMDCIRKGTTTVIDHHASPFSTEGSLDELARAALEAGVRACLCYEVSDRDGAEVTAAQIRENERFLKKCRTEPHDLLAAAFGLHASFTVSDDTLGECLDAARRENAHFHVHVAEDRADVEDSLKKYGMPVLSRLEARGLLERPTLAVHCVHLQEGEREILKKHPVRVIHNPESNMNNAVGCAAIPEMLAEGILVGLGSDGFTSNMFQEMEVLPLLHKFQHRDPRTLDFGQIYQTVFLNNPTIAGEFFRHPVGALKEGAFADIIALDYIPPTPMTEGNFLGHLLFGLVNAPVNTTIVNGRILMKDRKFPHLDEERIKARTRELAASVWERF